MLLAAVLVLGGLALMNRLYGGSWLFPSAAFCAIWSALVAGLLLTRDTFDRVSFDTLLIFGAGAACFSLGVMLVDRLASARYPATDGATPPQPEWTGAQRLVVFTGAAIFVVLLPAYWRALLALSAASTNPDLWQAIRAQTVAAADGDIGLGPLGLLVPFGTFFSLCAVYLGPRRRSERAVVGVIIVASLAVHIVTASRLGAFIMIFALGAVLWLRDGRVKGWHVATFAAGFAGIFSFAAVVLEKGAARGVAAMENAGMLADSFRVYLLGGLVAFDKVVQDPTVISPPYYSLRFFYALGSALRLPVEVPNIVLPFTTVPDLTNVYTLYYPYYTDFGLAGLCLLATALGGALTALYRAARSGKPAAAVLYSLAFAFLLLSSSVEGYLVNLSYWIRAAVFVTVFFRLPGWLGRLRPAL